jgi:hypothetical protein
VHVEFIPIRSGGGPTTVVLEFVPPGEWALSGRELYPCPQNRPLRLRPDARELQDRGYQIALRFADAAGRSWYRDWQGVLTRTGSPIA